MLCRWKEKMHVVAILWENPFARTFGKNVNNICKKTRLFMVNIFSVVWKKNPDVWLWRLQNWLGIFVSALTWPQSTAWEHSGTDILHAKNRHCVSSNDKTGCFGTVSYAVPKVTVQLNPIAHQQKHLQNRCFFVPRIVQDHLGSNLVGKIGHNMGKAGSVRSV